MLLLAIINYIILFLSKEVNEVGTINNLLDYITTNILKLNNKINDAAAVWLETFRTCIQLSCSCGYQLSIASFVLLEIY